MFIFFPIISRKCFCIYIYSIFLYCIQAVFCEVKCKIHIENKTKVDNVGELYDSLFCMYTFVKVVSMVVSVLVIII